MPVAAERPPMKAASASQPAPLASGRLRTKVGVGAAALEEDQAAERDRHHEDVDRQQVRGEGPGCAAHVRLGHVLDHHHLELPRQQDDREHGQQHEAEPLVVGEGLPPADEHARDLGRGGDARHQGRGAVEQAPGDEDADAEERQQLDHRLGGDRRHHALVALRRVEVPRAEDDGEAREHERDVERRVGPPGSGLAAGGTAGHQRVAAGHRLELQRDIGDDTDERDQRHQRRQRAALAVAAGDEIGDRGDAPGARDADHLAQHCPGQHHRQRRPQIDRQEPHAGARGAADAAEVGPGAAVDAHRERVHPAVGDDAAPRVGAAVGPGGDREERQQVGEGGTDDQRRRQDQARRRARERLSHRAAP